MRTWAILAAGQAALALAPTNPALAQQTAPVTVIAGTLLGADGRAMTLAHASLKAPSRRTLVAQSIAAADGRFAIATTVTGPTYLQLSGASHAGVRMPLLLDRPRVIELDVRLPPYHYTDSLDKVVAIGDWNGFSFRTGRPLVKQADGRYTLEVATTSDTLAYQLVHLATNRGSINGTEGAWYVYDGDGDYRSVIRAVNGKATIVLDPRLLDLRSTALQVTFRDPGSRDARTYDVVRLTNEWVDRYFDTVRVAQARADSVRWDWKPAIQELGRLLAREQDSVVRQLLVINLARVVRLAGHLDTWAYDHVTREVPASSAWWSFPEFREPVLLNVVPHEPSDTGRRDDRATESPRAREALAYLEHVVAEHPDPNVQAAALGALVVEYKRLHDDKRADQQFQRLVSQYPDAPGIDQLKAQFSPDRALRVGATMPDFWFRALEDSSVIYTRESMNGKPYLLEFWATWCEPCLEDMPYLQRAYNRFRSQGLEILSVSLDAKRSDVTTFLSGRWNMPWLRAFAPDGFNNANVKDLQILFLPRAVLVDRTGKIVATDSDLRAEKLIPTIERSLE